MSVNELQSAPCSSPLSFRICKWENSSALSSRKNNCGFVEIFMCTLRLHFWFQEYPDYVAYETPVFFEDDWLNLYLDETCTKAQQEDDNGQSDYRFVYMGPKGRSVPRFCCSFCKLKFSSILCFYPLATISLQGIPRKGNDLPFLHILLIIDLRDFR
jgi:hypothetical protein